MTSPISRPLPRDDQAEMAAIGSCLRCNAVIDDVAQWLRPNDFHSEARQLVFSAILDLHADGKPVDLVTLNELLTVQGEIVKVGGYGKLADFWDAAPTAASAVHYAKIVRETSIVRQLIHAANEQIEENMARRDTAAALLERAEKRIFAIAADAATESVVSFSEALDNAIKRIDARATREPSESYIPTGLIDLDSLILGLIPGELSIIAARPSVGKTALAVNLLRHACIDLQLPAFFVSMEQGPEAIAERFISCQAKIDGASLKRGKLQPDELDRAEAARDVLQKMPLKIDAASNQNVSRIAANVRRQVLRNGCRLVVIDYLQFITAMDRKIPLREQIGETAKRLKQLAKDCKIPVVCLCQLNRESERDGRPRLQHLKDSGDIEAHADVVALLWKEKKEPGMHGDPDIVHVGVDKNRDGQTGELKLVFDKKYMRFENHAGAWPAEPFSEATA